MEGLMADNDIRGHMNVLVHILESEAWRDLWLGLNLSIRTLEDLGLDAKASDAVIWNVCQKLQIVLWFSIRRFDKTQALNPCRTACGQLRRNPRPGSAFVRCPLCSTNSPLTITCSMPTANFRPSS